MIPQFHTPHHMSTRKTQFSHMWIFLTIWIGTSDNQTEPT